MESLHKVLLVRITVVMVWTGTTCKPAFIIVTWWKMIWPRGDQVYILINYPDGVLLYFCFKIKKTSFYEPHDKSSFLEVPKIMKLKCWIRKQDAIKNGNILC